MAGTEIMRISNLNVMEVQVTVNENDIVRIHLGDSADVKIDAYDNRLFKGIVTEIANSAVFNQTQNLNDQVTNFIVKVRLIRNSYSDLLKSGKSPFLPGMTASVDIHTDQKNGVLAVPIASVITRDPFSDALMAGSDNSSKSNKSENKTSNSSNKSDKSESTHSQPPVSGRVKTWVFVLENGTAKAVEVTTGIQDLDHYEILNGIKEGQSVITGPSMVVAKSLNHNDKVKVLKNP